jgi:hypothetical protein
MVSIEGDGRDGIRGNGSRRRSLPSVAKFQTDTGTLISHASFLTLSQEASEIEQAPARSNHQAILCRWDSPRAAREHLHYEHSWKRWRERSCSPRQFERRCAEVSPELQNSIETRRCVGADLTTQLEPRRSHLRTIQRPSRQRRRAGEADPRSREHSEREGKRLGDEDQPSQVLDQRGGMTQEAS